MICPNCDKYKANIDKVIGPMILQSARSGGRYQYEGEKFTHCPWCGAELEDTTTLPEGREGKTMEGYSFGWAIKRLDEGKRVCREGWNGKGMWLALQVPDHQSKMTLPYIYMKTVQGDLVPWLASQTDMLSNDWEIAE